MAVIRARRSGTENDKNAEKTKTTDIPTAIHCDVGSISDDDSPKPSTVDHNGNMSKDSNGAVNTDKDTSLSTQRW